MRRWMKKLYFLKRTMMEMTEEEARKEIRASAEEKQQLQARKMAALDTELDSIYFGNS